MISPLLATDQTLRQLARQSQIESLLEDLRVWSQAPVTSRGVREQQRLVASLLEAAPELVARIQSPLLVATFGGTGVGKSTLVNALVGAEVTRAGVTRPTTCIPTLVTHTETALTSLGFSPSDVTSLSTASSTGGLNVQRLDLPILKQFVLLDFPDVDTDEEAGEGSNLARVRALLPLCDVLIVVSTQEKYLQARLRAELRAAVTHARVIFVQTFADRDDDIRDDWLSKDLAQDFDVHEIFFVDSKRALDERRRGLRPTGDFGRLLATLEEESIDGARPLLRHNNLVDLIRTATSQGSLALEGQIDLVDQVTSRLDEQDRKLTGDLTEQLKSELLGEQQPWEQRLVASLAEKWSLSPLSALLRLRVNWSKLLGSYALLRSRTVVQATIAGSLQAADWWQRRQRDGDAQAAIDSLATTALSDAALRNLATIVQGDVRQAGLDPIDWSIEERRQEAGRLQLAMCLKARESVDRLIERLLEANASPTAYWMYEILFCLFPAWLLWRVGYNFFYEAFWLGKPHLETSFYLPAALLLAGWCGLWLWLLTRRLKRGMEREIKSLAEELARQQIPGGLFAQLRERVNQFRLAAEELKLLDSRTASLQQELREIPTRLSQTRR